MELQSGTVLPEQKIIPLKQNAPPLELLEEELLELEEVKHSHLQVVKLGMQPISRGQIIGPQPELEELEIIPLLLELDDSTPLLELLEEDKVVLHITSNSQFPPVSSLQHSGFISPIKQTANRLFGSIQFGMRPPVQAAIPLEQKAPLLELEEELLELEEDELDELEEEVHIKSD